MAIQTDLLTRIRQKASINTVIILGAGAYVCFVLYTTVESPFLTMAVTLLMAQRLVNGLHGRLRNR
jgi:hypothetical protein